MTHYLVILKNSFQTINENIKTKNQDTVYKH